MNIYFGAAIQGNFKRDERAKINQALIQHVESLGHTIVTEHVGAPNKEEVYRLLEKNFGKIPENPKERTIFIRNTMVGSVEGKIDAAIFEVSIPSLGTGIEIAHAYLRPRLGLPEIPVLALYEKDFWPNGISSMVKGITPEVSPTFQLFEYSSLDSAKEKISSFLGSQS